MNIYIYTEIPDDLNVVIATDTLRGCGHTIVINPVGEIEAHENWIIVNASIVDAGPLLKLLKDKDLSIRVGFVGRECPNEFKEFIEPAKGNLARFEHFSDWNNLIYRHLWTQ